MNIEKIKFAGGKWKQLSVINHTTIPQTIEQ
jgi:hypothetical protein